MTTLTHLQIAFAGFVGICVLAYVALIVAIDHYEERDDA